MNKSRKLFAVGSAIRLIVILFAIGAVIIGCTSPGTEIEKLPVFQNEHGTPYLIVAQQPGLSNRPANIVKNIDHIESLPFDGMFIEIIPWSWIVMDGEAIVYDDLYEKLSVLKGAYTKFQYNFLYIFINYPGDFWDDDIWEVTANNFALMAKAAKEVGLKGIVYDNEEYQEGKWLNYGEDYKNPDYDLDEHAEQVMLRGKQIMEAMVNEFPDIEIFNYHGPYLSESKTSTPEIIMGQAASYDKYELLGPFFVGMMLGRGDAGTIIDGGEVYQYRAMDDFTYSYQVRKYDIASEETNCWFIPNELRPNWPDDINISFGVYNRQWKPDFPMNSEIMKTTLFNALSSTDKYVWYYTEHDNWLEPGKMPQNWVDAVRDVYEQVHD